MLNLPSPGARIATVGYGNLLYHTIPADSYVRGATREALMGDVLARMASGEVSSSRHARHCAFFRALPLPLPFPPLTGVFLFFL